MTSFEDTLYTHSARYSLTRGLTLWHKHFLSPRCLKSTSCTKCTISVYPTLSLTSVLTPSQTILSWHLQRTPNPCTPVLPSATTHTALWTFRDEALHSHPLLRLSIHQPVRQPASWGALWGGKSDSTKDSQAKAGLQVPSFAVKLLIILLSFACLTCFYESTFLQQGNRQNLSVRPSTLRRRHLFSEW